MKIVVLAGGTSTERFVSLISGMQIYKALKSKGHETVLLDVYLGYDGPDADHISGLSRCAAERRPAAQRPANGISG